MGNKSSKMRSEVKDVGVSDLERGEGPGAQPPPPLIAQRRHKYNAPPPLQLPGQTLEPDLEAGVGGYSSQPPRTKFPDVAPVDASVPPPRKKSRGWFAFLKKDKDKTTQLPPDIQLTRPQPAAAQPAAKPQTAQPAALSKSSTTNSSSNMPYSLNISASVPMAVGGGSSVCQVCGRWASITCDKCSSATYCGKRCMLQHATVHASICRQLAREKRAQASAVPDVPEELAAVAKTSCSMAQTAFALSGMLDPTFLVVHSAGTGRDTSMLEGLMQVEGFTTGGVPVTAFVILEDGGQSARSAGDSGSRASSQRGSGASTPSRGWYAGSKQGSGASTPTRGMYASTLDQMAQMTTPPPLSQVVVHGSGGDSYRSNGSGGSSGRSSVDAAAEAARAVLVERMMLYVKKNSLSTYAFWFEGYHEDFIEDDPMRSLVWPSVSCRLFDSIIVVCCDGRRTVTKGFRCVFNGDSVAFEPLHSSSARSSAKSQN